MQVDLRVLSDLSEHFPLLIIQAVHDKNHV